MQTPDRQAPSAIDRRNFLANLASGTAATLAAGQFLGASQTAASAKDRWKMRLSCSSINFASLPIEKAIERIAELGFDAIDVWSAHAGCPHLDDVLERLGPEGLMELLDKHDLDLYSFSVYRGGYELYAELLGKAGGGVAVRGSTKSTGPENLTTDMKAFLESLKPLAELAEKHNSYLAIENHANALLNSIDSFKAFVDLNTNPRLGIALAPYHVQGYDGSVTDAIKICGDQLLFFYAWQKGADTEQLPGVGPTDCTPWLATLAEVGFRWPVNPFMHHEPEPDEMSEAMAGSCKYLKSCYAKAVPG